MKVLFFNYEYPPLGGGAAHATENILKEYVKYSDLEVDLITSSFDSEYHLDNLSENIHVHRLPIGKNKENAMYQSQKQLIVYSWKAFFFARKLIKKAKREKTPYDLTHSFFTVPCGFISMLLRFEFGLPYVVSLRGSDVPYYSERFMRIYFILKWPIVFIWKMAAAVIANSLVIKKLALKSNQRQEIGVIYNGVYTDVFKPEESPVPHENFTILCASRLSRRKGFNYAIDAFAKIYKKYPNLRLTIAGGEGNAEGELRQQVKDFGIEDKVSFTGLVDPNTEYVHHHQASDVFVLPSDNEGMSNNMLEAMASGMPIIMTPTGGADELIVEGANGYIVKFKDGNDIAEKLEKLINNPELTKSMGMESRKIAEKMSWKSVAEQYFAVYEQVSKNKK
ncbi:MAG: glycosyltransferase family 4 protein [Parcubacteria group bacterium]|jgi:glycosyltransferase involved in cell wall biosynthesis